MIILFPSGEKGQWDALLQKISSQPPLPSFDPLILDYIQKVSDALLNDTELRSFPEIIALGFWMRTSHIKEIRKEYDRKRQERVWLPRGLAIHFAPANVDTIFVYSWFLSLLAGNSNIIRLPGNRSEQINSLLNRLNEILASAPFRPIYDRTLIVSYPHDDTITRALCAQCQIRVIWGGDDTIAHMRQIPLPPSAIEMAFADKFSCAALNASIVANEPEKTLTQLAENFYNDAFWFGQMACSSPRLIIWVGNSSTVEKAKIRFWKHLDKIIHKKNLKLPAETGISRMATAYHYAAQGAASRLSSWGTDFPLRAEIETLNDTLRSQHCGGGLFLEMDRSELTMLASLFTRKDQTLAVYGFEPEELKTFAWTLGSGGVDRIVPIGKALEFHPVWDGSDCLLNYTREITILPS